MKIKNLLVYGTLFASLSFVSIDKVQAQQPETLDNTLASMPLLHTMLNDLHDNYYRYDSSQFTGGHIVLKNFNDDLIFFYLNIFEGNENDGQTMQMKKAGFMTIKYGKAYYNELAPDGDNMFTMKLIPGDNDDVELIIDNYTEPEFHWKHYWKNTRSGDAGGFIDTDSALIFLENLPSAATSLNKYTGAADRSYKLVEANDMIGNYFYQYKAFTSNGKLIGKYWFTKDLHAIYRVDPDMAAPVLIFGNKTQDDDNALKRCWKK